MTEEEAIKEVISYLPKDEPMNEKDREAFFMAIKALGQSKESALCYCPHCGADLRVKIEK